MNKKEFSLYREKLILSTIKKLGGKATVNEVIEYIWRVDKRKNITYSRGWRFYVHLNKFPAVMEKRKLIEHTGFKFCAHSGREEKVWTAY
jgi:hypothetical protein